MLLLDIYYEMAVKSQVSVNEMEALPNSTVIEMSRFSSGIFAHMRSRVFCIIQNLRKLHIDSVSVCGLSNQINYKPRQVSISFVLLIEAEI